MSIDLQLYKAPESQLIRLRSYHEDCQYDAERKIKDINNILDERRRMREYRARLKSYAEQYIESAACECPDMLIRHIKNDLSCSTKYARDVAQIAKKSYLKSERHKRDQKITLMAEFMDVPVIAKRVGLSRQQVYNILKK